MHVHHTIGFDQAIHDFIPYACQEIGIEYDITVHDYFFVCPRINLINAQEVYCGEPAISSCEKCVTQNKSYIGNLSVWQWRFRYERLLAGARKVFTPSNDVSTRMKRYYPAVTFTTMPHIEAQAAPAQPIAAPSGETVKVAIIGALGVHKGSNIILACAKDAKRRKLPIEYVIFGDSDLHDGLKAQKNVYLHGQYKEGEIFSLLAAKPCHFAFFPSVWPETYCYTLSIAFQAKLYPVTFDLGAPADRIRAAGWGSVLPITLMDDAEKLNDALMSVVVTPAPDTQILPAGNELYPSITKDYYALPELSSGQ